MGFWRKEVIDFALGSETRLQMEEQLARIQCEPYNPRLYYHLAQFYRMEGTGDTALGLLLEAVRLDACFAEAHASLSEIYAAREDYGAAWRHARLAERGGIARAVELLKRYRIAEHEASDLCAPVAMPAAPTAVEARPRRRSNADKKCASEAAAGNTRPPLDFKLPRAAIAGQQMGFYCIL